MKIVLAIDSFKGCLTSCEAEEAVACGIRSQYPDCEIVCIPVADGGEGLVQTMVSSLNGSRVSAEVHDPLMRPIETAYGVSSDGTTAFIEMAAASGLPLLTEDERNPMQTTSYGTGELIVHAIRQGCRDFVFGLGGSATNDAGFGMLQAMGFHFLDDNGIELKVCGGNLSQIVTIDSTNAMPELADCRFRVACDVCNPFAGPQGAACVFAPQKGANAEMVNELDEGLKHVAELILNTIGLDILNYPGAGAAGGMGGGVLAFLHTTLHPGADLLLDLCGFDSVLADADLVITGEGQSDAQTMMGKLPSAVLGRSAKAGVPVVLLSGAVNDVDALNASGFTAAFSILPKPMQLAEAMLPNVARTNLKHASRQIVRLFGIRA